MEEGGILHDVHSLLQTMQPHSHAKRAQNKLSQM